MAPKRLVIATAIASMLLSGCPLRDNYYLGTDVEGTGGTGATARGGAGTAGKGLSGTATTSGGAGSNEGGAASSEGGATGLEGGATGLEGGATGLEGGATGSGGSGGKGVAGAGAGSGGSAGKGVAGAGGNGPNLIANPGFENGTSGWGVHGTVVGVNATITSSTQAWHSGTRSLLISGRTQNYQGPIYSLTGLVTPGKRYVAGVWVLLPTGYADSAGFNVTLRSLCNTGAYEYAPWVYNATVSSQRWTQLTGTNTLVGCSSGTINGVELYVEGPAAVYAFYVDDIFFGLA